MTCFFPFGATDVARRYPYTDDLLSLQRPSTFTPLGAASIRLEGCHTPLSLAVWEAALAKHPRLVSYPDPRTSQLRMDYITATLELGSGISIGVNVCDSMECWRAFNYDVTSQNNHFL